MNLSSSRDFPVPRFEGTLGEKDTEARCTALAPGDAPGRQSQLPMSTVCRQGLAPHGPACHLRHCVSLNSSLAEGRPRRYRVESGMPSRGEQR